MLAGEAELRLDQLLPGVEVLLDLAGQNLAELGVDTADVGGQRLDRGEEDDEEKDGQGHGFRPHRLWVRDPFSEAVEVSGLDFIDCGKTDSELP